MADFWIKDGERMLMIGDSITDAGARTGGDAPFGHGYVRMFVELVTARYPERNIEFLNRGESVPRSMALTSSVRGRWTCAIAVRGRISASKSVAG